MYERIIPAGPRRSSCTQVTFKKMVFYNFFVRNELAETRLEIAAITGGEFDEDEEGEGEEAELQRQIL